MAQPIAAAVRRVLPLAAAALIGLGMAGASTAASATSPEEVAAQRQEMLDDMLTRDSPYAIASQRWVCAMGQEPASVAESRAGGASFFPDAADSCVTALMRVAHDGSLPQLYGKLANELGGDATGSDALPRAIGAHVLHADTKVAIGNGKAAIVTPALAFDAGFAVAYQAQAVNKAAANAEQLKGLAEACLAQRQDAGTCFSAGYFYGAQSYHLQTATR